MAVCSKCGKKFGIFRAKRPTPSLVNTSQNLGITVPEDICAECLEELRAGVEQAHKKALAEEEEKATAKAEKIKKIENILTCSLFSAPFEHVKKCIYEYAQEQQMSMEDTVEAVKSSLHAIIEKSMEDSVVTMEEAKKINELFAAYEIEMDDLGESAKELLVKGSLIRDLMSGNVVPRVTSPDLPFKLMKSETLIWLFSCPLYELRTRSQLVGGSQGVSIRIMKGVYWRVGGFKGERVTSEEVVELGHAITAITSKHLYFSIDLNSRRLKHDKIISIAPYKNGVAVISDGARAKPLIFLPDDPWFFINALQNAQNWD